MDKFNRTGALRKSEAIAEKESVMGKFDYTAALKKLEAIAEKVEDPATGLEEIDKLIAESTKLIEQCRNYLRSLKD